MQAAKKLKRATSHLVASVIAAALLLASGAADAGPKRCAAARGSKASVADRACKRGDDDGAKPTEEKGVSRVRSGAHIEVVARDLRLTEVARERLERIAARYHKATRRRLVITGGTRTPHRQAELMFQKLAHGEDIVALYENKQAATEVKNAHKEGVAKGLPRKGLIKVIREAIEAQITRGVYVSKHLKSGAADVRSRDMTPTREEAFRAAVSEEPGVVLLDERKSAEPHLHLSL